MKKNSDNGFGIVKVILVLITLIVFAYAIFLYIYRDAFWDPNVSDPYETCSRNLATIGHAISMYHNVNGLYPNYSPRTGEILVHGYHHHKANSPGECFIECLFMGKKPIVDFSEYFTCYSYFDGVVNDFDQDKTNYNFDIGSSGFLYRNTNDFPLEGQDPKTTPVACDRAGNHKDGFHILYLDGTVKFYKYNEAPYGFGNVHDPRSPLKDQPPDGSGITKGNDLLVE